MKQSPDASLSPAEAATELDEPYYNPTFQTARFDVFYQRIVRNPALGCSRHVYQAWYRFKDVPYPVCLITCWANTVEFVEVNILHRRRGVATEVLRALEQRHQVSFEMRGLTSAGAEFIRAYTDKFRPDQQEPASP